MAQTQLTRNDSDAIDYAIPDNTYFEFASKNYYFLSKCVVINRVFDPDSDRRLTLDEWDTNYRIIQFWDTKEVPQEVRKLITGWKDSVPDGCHILFDEASARKFILEHYPTKFVRAYDLCYHPAMKSDYFRLAYLYLNGGVYIDADEKMLRSIPNMDFSQGEFIMMAPFIRERDDKGRIVGVRITEFLARKHQTADGTECYFANSPIFATKRSEILKIALVRATDLILESKGRGSRRDVHFTTGPTNLTLSLVAHLVHAACAGKPPPNIMILEWFRYSATQVRLEYKNDSRNWRNLTAVPSASPAPCLTNPDSITIFTRRFEKGGWGRESKSGPGSTLARTKNIRLELPVAFKRLEIRRLVDAACGDMNWMRHLSYEFSFFIGVDIVDELIASLRAQFDPELFHFQRGDISEDILPLADAVLCRDCLGHLPFAKIRSAIRLFKISGAGFLLTTTFPEQTNRDCALGGWRPLNLQAEPFNWPAPDFLIREDEEGRWRDKSLGVWAVSSIP